MKKGLILLSVLLLTVFMLTGVSFTGCKATTTTETTAVETTAAATTAVETTAATTTAAETTAPTQQYKGQKLTVIYFSANYRDAAYDMRKGFEDLTGASVTILDSPYQTLYEKEFTDLVAGAGSFDVMQIAAQWGGQFAPYLEPLESRIQNSGDWGSMADFIPAVATASGDWQGVRYGIPMSCDAYSIFYRTDLFKNAGITLSKIDGVDYFANWDDLKNAAKLLTKDGVYGYTIEGEKSQLGCFWRARTWVLGGHMLSKDYKTPLPERDIAVNALQMMIDFKPYMPPGYLSYDIFAEYNAFVQGKVAMAEVWPSLVRTLANDPEQSKVIGNWAVMPMPGGPARPSANELSSWYLGIAKDSKNKDLAWEWIKYYTSEASQRRFLDKFGVGPTRSVIYQDPSVLEANPDFPAMLASLKNTVMRFKFAASQETMDYADARISDALSGSITSQTAIDKIVQFWTEKISNNPPEGQYTDDYLQ